jgi:uncharacterized protein (TIGR02466 family)
VNDHAISIFNTPIWGYTLSNEKYHAEDYLSFIEELQIKEHSVSKSNSNGAWQSRDNLHEEPIFKEVVDDILLRYIATDILKEYNIEDFSVQSMWANVNGKHSFNYQHTHEGYISGVLYLKVPRNSGRLIFTNPIIRSEQHPIRTPNYPINPTPLACIVFPSWLEHYVEPNTSDDTRISLSFNIGK